MNDPARHEALCELLREASRVHHQAYIAVDGDDADWPLWYAGYLLERLRKWLDPALTRSELVTDLVLAAEDHTQNAPDDDWAAHYARFLVSRRGG
ncbi:MAG: hypothetical protein GX613_05160 [Chloroflexi bacterium]|mgnify:FL=1|nr:hypothetical protein [Chloroflexota bacterium]